MHVCGGSRRWSSDVRWCRTAQAGRGATRAAVSGQGAGGGHGERRRRQQLRLPARPVLRHGAAFHTESTALRPDCSGGGNGGGSGSSYRGRSARTQQLGQLAVAD